MFDSPHRRFNPLTRDWVLVSPQRMERPWQGQVEKVSPEYLPSYDPKCYLCPGNARAGGAHNPRYTGTYVFDNDFAALLPDTPPTQAPSEGLLRSEAAAGICRVVCFSPRHDLTLPELSQAEVEAVVSTWTKQTADLGSRPGILYVQVFENKGEMMGCSNPHPHSQIWANAHIPNEPARELASQIEYHQETRHPMLLDYLAQEHRSDERVVTANDHFTALVPFWAVWPFEILLVAHRPTGRLTDMNDAQRSSLADILRRITARYDNLFEIYFPYSMGFHQAPMDGQPHPEWVFHAHFYPPLLRSATIRKFMVGYEMLAMPQRDLTPEAAAERLRSLSEVHFHQSA